MTPGNRRGINILHRLSIPSGEDVVLDSRAYRFAVDGRYLFVSRQNFSGNAISDDSSRLLYVCDDYGASEDKITFSEVQLPSVTPEQVRIKGGGDGMCFYVVLSLYLLVLCDNGYPRSWCIYPCIITISSIIW